MSAIAPLSAAAAPATAAPKRGFVPSHLDLKGVVDISMIVPDTRAKFEQRMDMRPVAEGFTPDRTTQRVQLIENGKVIENMARQAKITPDEHSAAAAVRDALVATNYLKDARPLTSAKLPLNGVRMSWQNADKTKSMIEFSATEIKPGYEALHAALETYTLVAGLSVASPSAPVAA